MAYFLILKQWAIYVKKTLVSPNFCWKDLPGYRRILKSLLLELKERDIYPAALTEATCAMLYNEKILNVMVQIVLKKVHAFDTAGVMQALEMVCAWFSTIARNK